MSRINTNILQVPGVPTAQSDERAAGQMDAPLQAAGRAMQQLGDLGKEIAVREQRLDDQRVATSIINQADQYAAEVAQLAAESDSLEEVNGIIEAANERFGLFASHGDAIQGKASRERLMAELSLRGGRAQIGLETRARAIKVSDTRNELNSLMETIALEGLVTGDTDTARRRIRQLLDETEGLSYSKEEADAVYKNAIRAMTYYDVRNRIYAGEDVDLSTEMGLDVAQYGELAAQKASFSKTKMTASNRFEVSYTPTRARQAARGVFSGETVGSDEALKRLVKHIGTLEYSSDAEKAEAIRVAKNIFRTTQIMDQMVAMTDQNRAFDLDTLANTMTVQNTGLDPEQVEKLQGEARARARSLETELNQEALTGIELELDKYNDGIQKKIDSGEDLPDQEAYRDGLKAAAGIGPNTDYTNYPDGAAVYFRVMKEINARANRFQPTAGDSRVQLRGRAGGGDLEAADKLMARLAPIRNGQQSFDGVDRALSAMYSKDAATNDESKDLHAVFVGVAKGAEMPPDLVAYFKQLENPHLEDGQRVLILSAFSKLSADPSILLHEDRHFPDNTLTGKTKAELALFRMHRDLPLEERIEKSKEARTNTSEMIKLAMQDQAVDKDRLEAFTSFIESRMKLQGASPEEAAEETNLAAKILMNRGMTPEEAARVSETSGGQELLDLFLAYHSREFLMRFSEIELAAGDLPYQDLKKADKIREDAVRDWIGHGRMSRFGNTPGQAKFSSSPVESIFLKTNTPQTPFAGTSPVINGASGALVRRIQIDDGGWKDLLSLNGVAGKFDRLATQINAQHTDNRKNFEVWDKDPTVLGTELQLKSFGLINPHGKARGARSHWDEHKVVVSRMLGRIREAGERNDKAAIDKIKKDMKNYFNQRRTQVDLGQAPGGSYVSDRAKSQKLAEKISQNFVFEMTNQPVSPEVQAEFDLMRQVMGEFDGNVLPSAPLMQIKIYPAKDGIPIADAEPIIYEPSFEDYFDSIEYWDSIAQQNGKSKWTANRHAPPSAPTELDLRSRGGTVVGGN